MGREREQESASASSYTERDEANLERLISTDGKALSCSSKHSARTEPSYPGYLRIILNNRQRQDSNGISDIRQPPAYLQVRVVFVVFKRQDYVYNYESTPSLHETPKMGNYLRRGLRLGVIK